MSGKNHLYVLWTNDNPVTAEKMVFMVKYWGAPLTGLLKNGEALLTV